MIASEIRKSILSMLYESQASHLGPCMSMVEILITIYRLVNVEQIKSNHPLRNRVIVSKGHAAAAVYAVLAHAGILPMSELDTYCQEGSSLIGHVCHGVPGIEHSTGALGHGASVALGCAIGLKGKSNVHCILGDGELQEGSVWEAFMLAGHMKLPNLTFYIDNNRMSSLGNTDKVINMEPMQKKFRAFNLKVCAVDGHDVSAIQGAINWGAQVIICNTIKGKGVSFAENNIAWHYKSLTKELYEKALSEL